MDDSSRQIGQRRDVLCYDDNDDVNAQVLDCLHELERYLSRIESTPAETGKYYVFL